MSSTADLEGALLQQQSCGEFIHVTVQESRTYTVFIDEDIIEPKHYRELLSLLFNASENDHINFMINSGGGNLSTALAIVEAINHTEAGVTANIIGDCHSAASIIMLNCPEVVVCDSASCLVHTASYGISGNNGMVKAFTEFNVQQIDRLLDETYSGFLTETELENVKQGIELWFTAEDIRKRLKKRHAWLIEKCGQSSIDARL